LYTTLEKLMDREIGGSGLQTSVAVKVDRLPARSTAMSPSIRCARRRTIERPSPVPPYRRVVELSACVNGE
jgi:hypothetical protein